jgi:hypothetical protein
MKISIITGCTLFCFLLSLQTAKAESMFERKVPTGQLLHDVLLSQGVPQEALDLTFKFFDLNQGKVPNTRYAMIADYSLNSTSKRLYLMNLMSGLVQRFYVAHGINTGVLQSRKFSNRSGTHRSSLGFYFAKGTYNSEKNGLSMYLDGLDRSNDQARSRLIVFHGARYVSDDFVRENHRLGWSQGCLSVERPLSSGLIQLLKEGSIILSYHRQLLAVARQHPDDQQLPGEEIVPPNVKMDWNPLELEDDNIGEYPFIPFERPLFLSPLDFYPRFD